MTTHARQTCRYVSLLQKMRQKVGAVKRKIPFESRGVKDRKLLCLLEEVLGVTREETTHGDVEQGIQIMQK